MIDCHTLLETPFGTRISTLCAESDLVRDSRLGGRYRLTPTQYLEAFEEADGSLRFRGFAWFASAGAARVVCRSEGWADIGQASPPPDVLLPRPGMLNADEIAAYGRQTEPLTLRRYVTLTHRIEFGDFCYHYEMMTPRPGDAPIAIEVNRDHRLDMPICGPGRPSAA